MKQYMNSDQMRIVHGDVCLRRHRESDADSLQAIADNPAIARFLTDTFPAPYTAEDARTWIALTRDETRPCNFVIEWRGRYAGGIGLVPLADVHSGSANLGYWIGQPFWGRGVATAAVAAILPYAFDELRFIRLQALVFAGNTASMRVLEKNGFVREGVMRKHVRKNGVVSDAVLYAKLRNE